MTPLHGESSHGAKFMGKIVDPARPNILPPELRGKEQFTRNEVVGHFNNAYGLLEKECAVLMQQAGHADIFDKIKANTPLTDDEKNILRAMSDGQKKRLSDYQTVKAGKEATDIENQNPKDKLKIEITKADGTKVNLEEGIATDGLLDFLHDRVRSLKAEIHRIKNDGTIPQDQKDLLIRDKEQLMRSAITDAYVLYKNSAPSEFRVETGQPAVDGTDPFFRAQAEAYFIAQDPTRDTGDGTQNWYAGLNAMRRRMNLNFAGVQSPTPAVTPAVTPTPPPPAPPPAPGPAPTPGNVNVLNHPQPVPVAQPVQQLGYQIAVANQSEDFYKRASDLTEEAIRHEQKKGHWYDPRTWVRKIKMRVFEDYYRQLWRGRLLGAMRENNNSFLSMDVVRNILTDPANKKAEFNQGQQAKIEEVKLRLQEQLVGNQQIIEAQGPMRDIIMTDLIRPLFNHLNGGGAVTEDQMQELLRRFVKHHLEDVPHPDATVRQQLKDLFGRTTTKTGELATAFASDMLDMTKRMVQDHQAHGYSLDQIDQQTKIILANTSWAAETEADFGRIDKGIMWLQEHRLIGGILNPAVLAGCLSAATYFGLRVPGGILRKAAPIVAPVVGGVFGGAFAAAKRSMDLKRDRVTHQRERAYGAQAQTRAEVDARLNRLNPVLRKLEQISGTAYKRVELEELAYDVATVDNLIGGGGHDIVRNNNRRSIDDLLRDPNNPENQQDLISRIAEIRTRLDYSRGNEIDLIQFKGKEQVEQGRLQLIKEIVRMRQALRSAGVPDAQITAMEANWSTHFTGDQTAKDKAFNNYRHKSMVGAFGLGFGTGMLGGIIGQEVTAGIARASGHIVHDTFLGAIGHTISGNTGPEVPTIEGLHEAFSNPTGGEFSLGNNHFLDVKPGVPGSIHEVIVHDAAGNQIGQTMHMDASGHMSAGTNLDPAIQNELKGAGFTITNGPDTTIMADTTNSQIQTLTINGHSVTTEVPKGELPDHTLWHGEWKQNSDGSFNLIAIKDTGPDAGNPVTFSDGTTPIQLAENVRIDQTGHLIGGKGLNGAIFGPEKVVQAPSADPQWVSDLQSGKMVNGTTGFSFKADAGILHVYQGGNEIQVLDPVNNPLKISFQNGQAFVTYDGISQNTVPSNILTAIESTGTHIQNNAIFPPRVSNVAWDNYIKALGGKSIQMDETTGLTGHMTGVPTKPPVPWPASDTGEHFPYTSKPFDHFFEGGKHANAEHIFADGTLGKEGNVDVINWNNGAQSAITPEMAQAYAAAQNSGLKSGDGWTWIIQRPAPPGEDYLEGYKAAILSNGQMEADVPIGLEGKVWASFGYLDKDGVFHKMAGYGPTESLKTPIGFIKEEIVEQKILLPNPITEPTLAITPPNAFDAPFIITPLMSRQPMDELRTPVRYTPGFPYYYNTDLFRRPDGSPATLSDIFSYNNSANAQQFPSRTQNRPVTNTTLDGENALNAIRDTFQNTSHIYIGMAGAIGDVVLTTAYVDGIRKVIEKSGQTKQITLIVPPNIVSLIQPYATNHNIEIVTENRYQTAGKALSLIQQRNESKALFIELDHHSGRPQVETAQNDTILVHDLFASSLGLYDNNRSGNDRFSHFLNDFLSLTPTEQVDVHPIFELPSNADQIYNDVKTKYSIDTSKKQIAIVLEASHKMKRYSLSQWKEVIDQIKQQNPNVEINLVYNPSGGSYTQQDLDNVFTGTTGVRYITENMDVLPVFVASQDVVLSNDTGLAHLAASTSYNGNQPKVISLHLPIFAPNVWIGNSNRHIGLLPNQSLLANSFDADENDESKKWINKIDSHDISRATLSLL